MVSISPYKRMTGADFYKCFTAILHSLLACIIPYLHSTFYMSPLFGHFIFAWTYGKSIYISVRLILSALAPERTKKLPLRPRVTGAHQYRLFYNSMVDNSHKIVDFKAGTAYETPGGYVLRGNSKHLLSHGEFKGLAEISLGGAELLRHLRQLQLQKRTPKQSEITESRPQAQEPLLEEAPSDEVLARVSRGLQRRQLRSAEYHRQRAFVLAALRCCYSDYSIAVACVKLDIDRDSYTKDRLPFWETLADMKKLRVATKVTHGSYCERGVARRPRGEQALEVNLKRLNERVKRRAPESTRTFRQCFYLTVSHALATTS